MIFPVFIGGCGRSGTTLLGAMLGAHSGCVCTPESQFKIDILSCIPGVNEGKVSTVDVLDFLERNRRFWLWALDVKSISAAMEGITVSYAGLIECIVKMYAGKVGKSRSDIWIDHTPDNMQYSTTLLNYFPEAKMIHIIRDGRAVASSIMGLDWGRNAMVTAAHWWAENVGYGLASESSLGEKRVLRIKYEDLVVQPVLTLKNICSFLDMEYQPSMAVADGFKAPKYTAQQHTLVGTMPDEKRVDAWKNELTRRQIELFESLTGDLLIHLGYRPEFGIRVKCMTDRERLAIASKEIYRYILNRFKLRWRLRLTKDY